jgi:hypothetical protein
MNKTEMTSQILSNPVQRNKPLYQAQISDHAMVDGKGGIEHALWL